MQLLTALALSLTLSVPGRTNATPTVAAAGNFVVVTWGATLPSGVTDVFAAVSRDGAKTFGPPVRVNNVDGDARLNGEQPPRAALVAQGFSPARDVAQGFSPARDVAQGFSPAKQDPLIAVVWTTKGTSGTRIVMSRSVDGGKTFSPAVTVPEGDAPGNRGWHNVLATRDGRLLTIWLDHREMADHAMGAAPQHSHPGAAAAPKEDGATMAQKSKLYVGAVEGGTPPHAVAAGVCYCCKTAITQTADGAIFTAWRHVYPGNFRDMAMSVSRDGGRTFAPPARVSEDKWMLEGCLDDGLAIAADAHNLVHIVWPTLVTDPQSADSTIAVFYATTRDGQTFTARSRVPTEGVAHHPQIAIDRDGSAAMVWDESANGRRRVVMARGPQMTRVVLSGPQSGVYPSIATSGASLVVAWAATGERSQIEVRVQ